MRRTFLLFSALVVVACGRKDDGVMADSPAAAGLPAPLSFTDFAGRWNLQMLSDMSDSVVGTFELNATADGSSWTLTPPGGEPIPVRSAVEADSLLIDAGPYKSSAVPSGDVTTHAVSRLEGGVLVGTFLTQYAIPTGDSVVRGRIRGTRVP